MSKIIRQLSSLIIIIIYPFNMVVSIGDDGFRSIFGITNDVDMKKEIRDLKISLLENELDLSVSEEKKEKFRKELLFLKDECPNDIISGSLALNLYGLINRDIKDIDILISDKDRYSNYNNNYNHLYSNDEKIIKDKRLGYIKFSHSSFKVSTIKSKYVLLNYIINTYSPVFSNIVSIFSSNDEYLVDFFENSDSSYETFTFNGHVFKIHNLLELIDIKQKILNSDNKIGFSLSTHKHLTDLHSVFRNLKYK